MDEHRTEDGSVSGTPLREGVRVGNYQILRPLRAGGAAIVYEARDEASGRLVALKVLHPALRADPSFQSTLRLEELIAARVRHRGVVPVLGVETFEGSPVLVAALLEGIDLAEHLARAGPLGVADALEVAVAALEVLAAVHDAGVVHCDLKPANLFLVGGTSDLRVLDFGVARLRDDVAAALDGDLARFAARCGGFGTPGYMPPEQIERPGRVEPRSDLFAVGVTLYECLTRRRPFLGDTPEALLTAMRAGHYRAASALRADVPAAVEGVLERALRPHPEERHPSAESMADALRPSLVAARGGGVGSPDTPADAPPASPTTSTR